MGAALPPALRMTGEGWEGHQWAGERSTGETVRVRTEEERSTMGDGLGDRAVMGGDWRRNGRRLEKGGHRWVIERGSGQEGSHRWMLGTVCG